MQNKKNLTKNQKEFLDSLRIGHNELIHSGHRYPKLACSIETLRTAKSLEKRELIRIGEIKTFEQK